MFNHAPFVPLGVNLHQLVGFLDGVGPRRDGRVLRRQLTAGASGWMARESLHTGPMSQLGGAEKRVNAASCPGLQRVADRVEVNESAN